MTTDTAPSAQQWNYDVLEREGEKRIQRVVAYIKKVCSVLPDNRLKMDSYHREEVWGNLKIGTKTMYLPCQRQSDRMPRTC